MDDKLKQIEAYPDVSFIDEISFQELQEQMVRDYEKKYKELTGLDITLARADPYRLMLYSCAVAIYQGYQYEDKAGKMGLLKYSYGDFLDNLAAFKGVKRNDAVPAMLKARFTLSALFEREAIIPKGVRVKSSELYFETTESGLIKPGTLSTDITMRCQTVGTIGNGILPGDMSLVDPLPYTLKVEGVTSTAGGADRESDEKLAERVFLAPAGYSTAGPEAAYAYWIKTFNASIGECRIVSESPGEVDIYITMEDGTVPEDNLLEELERYLEKSEIRPLTDHVVIKKPNEVLYNIDLTYFISKSSDTAEETTKENVKRSCEDYILWQRKTGKDIDPSQLIYQLVGAGATNIEVRSPSYRSVEASEIAVVGMINLVYGGVKND